MSIVLKSDDRFVDRFSKVPIECRSSVDRQETLVSIVFKSVDRFADRFEKFRSSVSIVSADRFRKCRSFSMGKFTPCFEAEKKTTK